MRSLCSSVAVNLGMLGTFIGIVYGLLDFNTNDINGSIPILLEGMKTAFVTSIFGMIAFIILKFIPLLPIRRTKDDLEKGDTDAEKMIGLLKEIAGNGQRNTALLEEMKKSISGDGETTLITQIQKLRTTTTDNLQELNKSFKEFAEKQAENNSKALIEALKDVMRDFNAKINEQFGDNFKQLNEAVGKMLVWQEKYKEHIEKMEENFSIALQGIEKCEKILEKITNDEASFQATADSLYELLETLNTDLVGIKDIGEEAKKVLPQIQKNIDTMTENFKNSIIEASQENKKILDKQREVINDNLDAINATSDKFGEEVRKICDHIESNVKQITQNFSTAVKEAVEENKEMLKTYGDGIKQQIAEIKNSREQNNKMFEEQRDGFNRQINAFAETHRAFGEAHQKMISEIGQQITRLMQENANKITSQIENMDKGLSEELNKTLTLMGRGLADISGKFVDDYRIIGETIIKLENEMERIKRARTDNQ